MAENFVDSYFELVSPEVLILILRDVETVDLLHFIEAYGCDYLIGEGKLTRKIDLYKQYYLVKDLKWLRHKVSLDYVTTLNINSLYWILTGTLTPVLRRLSNLETLYAIDTKLGLSDEDITSYKTSKKLKKLALSPKIDRKPHGCVQSVECLYLNLVNEDHFADIGNVFPSVSVLWVEVNDIATDPFDGLAWLSQMKKFILQVGTLTLPWFQVRVMEDLVAYYRTVKPEEKFTKCLISMPPIQMEPEAFLKSKLRYPWRHFEELPLGPKDSLRLFTDEVSFGDISFEELNFSHSACLDLDRKYSISILHSKIAPLLKKLCISICQFCCEECATSGSFELWEAGIGEKPPDKQPIDPDTPEGCPHIGDNFLKNWPELEELEVMSCKSSFFESDLYPLSIIKDLSKLKKLTVQVQVCVGSEFLPTVLEHCQQLEVLRIQSTEQNEALNHDIFTALPEAKCLKEFRYENDNIPLDRLMESLCLLKAQKLQRIAILCRTLDKFNCELVKPFLDQNPQLVFFHFRVHDIKQAHSEALQHTLNIHKKSQPWKVFIVGERNDSSKKNRMPHCHFDEMVKFHTKVATLDGFHDFSEF